MKRLGIIVIAVTVLGLAAFGTRAAENDPGKPIQLIVPYGLGA